MGAVDSRQAMIRHLWSSRMTAPDPDEDAEDRLELMQLVQQVKSVKFQSEPPAPTFNAPGTSQSQTEREQGEPAAEVQEAGLDEPPASPSGPSTTSSPLSAKAEMTLDDLTRHPDMVEDPFELAELLFLSGRRAEAGPFYERALANTSAGDPATDADRAWILFQLGNCLRETDLIRAKETYVSLIAEYPKSPWAEIAKAHGQLITWHQKTKPDRLIAREP